MKSAAGVFCFSFSLASNVVLAGTDWKISALICLEAGVAHAFIFKQVGAGGIRLLNEEGATVSQSGLTTTVVLADRVYQFQGSVVQALSNGTLQTWPCIDATEVALKIAGSEGLADEVREVKLLNQQNTALQAQLLQLRGCSTPRRPRTRKTVCRSRHWAAS